MQKTSFLASAAIALALVSGACASGAGMECDPAGKGGGPHARSDLGQDRSLLRHRHLAEGRPARSPSGNQLSVGTNRRLNGKTDEIIVAQTPYSYTYGQQPSDIQPGLADLLSRHLGGGAAGPRPQDQDRLYADLRSGAAGHRSEAKIANREQRTKRFTEALDNMKAMAESP